MKSLELFSARSQVINVKRLWNKILYSMYLDKKLLETIKKKFSFSLAPSRFCGPSASTNVRLSGGNLLIEESPQIFWNSEKKKERLVTSRGLCYVTIAC